MIKRIWQVEKKRRIFYWLALSVLLMGTVVFSQLQDWPVSGCAVGLFEESPKFSLETAVPPCWLRNQIFNVSGASS
ncbi:hypothetical protein [Candidatus Leptofilum sp.]|uniref:hypothetical protein n=1 Tax=Candidatus Leptofilum sp. TaxID=3241576 RepID=UPI003B597C19